MASDDWKNELDGIIENSHEEFVGLYSNAIKELSGLPEEEIAALTPDTTSAETYNQLIAVVEEASSKNISQAELANRIKSMGDVAVSIAKKSPTLARILL